VGVDYRKLKREFYTTREVARIFGRHIRTIRRWIYEGKLKSIKHSKSNHLIPRAEIIRKVNEWLE